MDCSMPGFPVHHQLLEPTQTHVHQVNDAIQLSHPLSSPSPPTFNPAQHQGLFQDKVEERSLEILKGEGIWLVVANFLGVRILCSCRSGHRWGHVFLSTSSKTNVILYSSTFISIWMEECYTFKDQSFEKRLSCIFQATGNILLQKMQSQCD